MNRLSRDQLINRALDMCDIPALDQHDRPSSPTVDPSAFAIGWLQDALDLFHNEFPLAGIVTKSAITIPTSGIVNTPSDFILDVRDGVIITDQPQRRLRRISLQEFTERTSMVQTTTAPASPIYYCVVPSAGIGALQFINSAGQLPDKSYAGQLWYHQLPVALSSTTVPNFPSDWVLIEYLRVRAMEWIRSMPPDSAWQYAQKHIGELRKSGLFNEAESDDIPLDKRRFIQGDVTPWQWLGDPISRT